jgi:hypothetical protein
MRKEIVGQPAYRQQLALGVFEVVTFSALFVVPHALKKTGVCPTLSDANVLISRDESDHMDAAAAMMQESFGTAPLEVRAAAVGLRDGEGGRHRVRRGAEVDALRVQPVHAEVQPAGPVL